MRGLRVVVLHERADHFAACRVARAGQEAFVTAQDAPAAHAEQLHHGVLARLREAEEVEVGLVRDVGALLGPEEFLGGLQAVAQAHGLLEVLFLRGFFHAVSQSGDDGPGAAFEEGADVVHGGGVLGGVGAVHAGAEAAAQVEVQAGARFVLHGQAGVLAQRVHGVHEVLDAPHGARVGVRAVVAGAVLEDAARDDEHREGLVREFQEGVVLVVLEEDVVVRAVLFDEVRFEHQRFDFVAGADEFEAGGFGRESPALAACLEVLVDAGAEVVGLADVDGHVRLAPEDVHAGGGGEDGQVVWEHASG